MSETRVIRKPWIIAVDLDGLLCKGIAPDQLRQAPPIRENIEKVNKLHGMGHVIVIHTARGWYQKDLTEDWLLKHGVHYSYLVMGKLYAHMYIDDLNHTLDSAIARLT